MWFKSFDELFLFLFADRFEKMYSENYGLFPNEIVSVYFHIILSFFNLPIKFKATKSLWTKLHRTQLKQFCGWISAKVNNSVDFLKFVMHLLPEHWSGIKVNVEIRMSRTISKLSIWQMFAQNKSERIKKECE